MTNCLETDPSMQALGIDIGGSGIKGAVVDTRSGELLTKRLRRPTPDIPDCPAIARSIVNLAGALGWKGGPVGIGFPGVIRDQVIRTAVNLHPGLVDVDLRKELAAEMGKDIYLINDADAAGCAEMRFGAGRKHAEAGTVLLVTVGTGIGTVLFSRGTLVPNLELGHVEFKGKRAETWVSQRARETEDLSGKEWRRRLDAFLQYLAFLLQPDLIILGGGGVKKKSKLREALHLPVPMEFAAFGNRAGIVGAALAAAEQAGAKPSA